MVKRTRHRIKLGYDTATSRLGSERLRAAADVFDRLAPERSITWDYPAFVIFLESALPSVANLKMDFTKLCFEAFAPYGNTLSFKDFVISLCVLAYGLPEERLRFAFDIFDDGRDEISKDTLRIWARCFGDPTYEFDFEGKLDLAGWMQWAGSHLDSCVVKWVFDLADIFDLLRDALPSPIADESDEETQYLSISKATNLHTFEVYGIAVVFKRVKKSRPTETMDFEGFSSAFPSVKDEELKREAFGTCDCMTLEEFATAIRTLWVRTELELGMRVDLELRPHSIAEEIRICGADIGGVRGPGDHALVESAWFSDWKAEQVSRPIDNSTLVQGLNTSEKEEDNFAVMSIPVYKALKLWYGGGPDVFRRAKLDGDVWRLDLFPLRVRCALTSKIEDVHEVRVYENEQVLDCACAEFNLNLVYHGGSTASSPRLAVSPADSLQGDRSTSATPVGSARGDRSMRSARAERAASKIFVGSSASSSSVPGKCSSTYCLWVPAAHHKRQTSFDPLALLRTRSSSDVKSTDRTANIDWRRISRWKQWNPGNPVSENQFFLVAEAEWIPPAPAEHKNRTFFRDDKKAKNGSSQPRGGGFFGLKAKADDSADTETSVKNGENDGALSSEEHPYAFHLPHSTGGFCGLNNLGNTCYMNSALQCLSQTRILREYFLSESFLRDINNDSTWGMQGRLAVEFYDVLRMLWTSTGAVSPTEFYHTISVFQNRFADNTQEDPQEFLALFLQGLSEDVCRIQDKPYIEIKDSGDRDDCEVASEYWNALMKRELSIVSVLFMGQFKSALSCRSCDHKNVTFDPFSSIALALSEETRTVTFPKVRLFDGRWKWVKVEMPEDATIADLRTNVAEKTGEEHWIFSRDCKQLKPLREDYALLRLQGQALVGFAVPPGEGPLCCIVHRRLTTVDRYFVDSVRLVEFDAPLLMRLENLDNPVPQLWTAVRHMAPECQESEWVCTLTTIQPYAHSACAKCGWTTGCPGCKVELPLVCPSATLDAIPTLALDWDEANLRRYYNAKNSSHEVELSAISCGTLQLEAMIETFLHEEIIEASCEKCEEKQCAKKMGVWGFPPYLMIQLKRFKDQGSRKHRGLVSFPVDELDLSRFVEKDAGHLENTEPQSMSFTNGRYDLYAVINHEGNLNRGHCYAFVKIDRGGEHWFEFSDAQSSPIEPEDVITNAAYVLFFVRKDIRKLSLEEMFATDSSKEAVDANSVRSKPAVPPQRRAACAIM